MHAGLLGDGADSGWDAAQLPATVVKGCIRGVMAIFLAILPSLRSAWDPGIAGWWAGFAKSQILRGGSLAMCV